MCEAGTEPGHRARSFKANKNIDVIERKIQSAFSNYNNVDQPKPKLRSAAHQRIMANTLNQGSSISHYPTVTTKNSVFHNFTKRVFSTNCNSRENSQKSLFEKNRILM